MKNGRSRSRTIEHLVEGVCPPVAALITVVDRPGPFFTRARVCRRITAAYPDFFPPTPSALDYSPCGDRTGSPITGREILLIYLTLSNRGVITLYTARPSLS